jgi:hypothetical protein
VCIIVLKEEIRNNLAGAHREEHGRRAVWLFLFLCYWLMKMFLTAKKAAEKLGINVAQFRRCVERGEIPPPCLNCRPKRWAVSQLESIGNASNVSATNIRERIINVLANEIR